MALNRKKHLVCGVLVPVLLIATSVAAFAGYRSRQFPGANCSIYLSSVANEPIGKATYVEAMSLNGAYVVCPISFDLDSALGAIQNSAVYVDYTRNNAQQDIYCALEAATPSGGLTVGPLVYACSTAGGCSGSTSWVGTGYLALPQVSMANVGSLALSCSIAGVGSSNIPSMILDYKDYVSYQ